MGIFSRFTDIINSNINSLLDSAEDPQKMIRLIIQEMEETLVEVRSSSARIIADKKEVSRRLDRLKSEESEWERKAKLALSKSREDLARAAIVERNGVTEALAKHETEYNALDDHIALLNDEVCQLQSKLNDAKSKQKAILMRAKTAESRYKVKKQLHQNKVDDAFTKFELFERRLDDFEGQVESMDLGKKDLASEIADLEQDEKVNDELARLKKELGEGK